MTLHALLHQSCLFCSEKKVRAIGPRSSVADCSFAIAPQFVVKVNARSRYPVRSISHLHIMDWMFLFFV